MDAPLEGADGDNERRSSNERRVFAVEQLVERIEIRFERSGGKQVGFSHGVLEEPPTSSNDE